MTKSSSTMVTHLAKPRDFSCARLFQGKLKVNVFGQPDFLVKKSSAAFVGELFAAVLQASQHTGIAGLDAGT